MTDDSRTQLPRLLVISDVNAERTAGGALALHRLLRGYPPDRLMVISHPNRDWPVPPERLPGVRYHDLNYRIPRWIWNRFNPFWPAVMARYVGRLTPKALAAAAEFAPEAVLSVAHDYLWFVAAAAARRLGLPLHLILHDDWPSLQTLSQGKWAKPAVRRSCERLYAHTLRQAATRFCVSPGMRDRYEERYGVSGRVLYPCRGEDSLPPRVRVRPGRTGPPVAAYAGLIHHGAAAGALRALAAALAELGGELVLYGPYPADALEQWGLDGGNVRAGGFFQSSREMAAAAAEAADILFLPASFRERERVDVTTLFPSKLADYTAIGLPILVWGPSYSSAARWAAAHPGATELVTDPDPRAVAGAAARLAADPDRAREIAAAGVAAGIRDFSVSAVRNQFYTALSESRTS